MIRLFHLLNFLLIEKLILNSSLGSYLPINLHAFKIVFQVTRHFSLTLHFLFSLFKFPKPLPYISFYNIFLNEPLNLLLVIYIKCFLSRAGFYILHLSLSFRLVSYLLRYRGVSWCQYFSFLLFFIFISLFLGMTQYWHINIIIMLYWINSTYYFSSSFLTVAKFTYLLMQYL